MKFKPALLLFLFAVSLLPGQDNPDPYLWLEDIDAEKSLNWVKDQNRASLKIIKDHPQFERLYKKNLQIYNDTERIEYPVFWGDYLYNFWQDGKHERGIWRRTQLALYLKNKPQWETVLDIDALSAREGKKWVFKNASWLAPAFDRCMIRLSDGGGDAVVMREFNMNTLTFVEDGFYLREAKGNVSWKDDNTLIVSTDFGEGSLTESGYPRISKIWKRGTPLQSAALFFEGEAENVRVYGYSWYTPQRRYNLLYQGIDFFHYNRYIDVEGKLLKLDIPMDASISAFFKNRMLLRLKSDWQPQNTVYHQGSLISIGFDKFLAGSRDFSVLIGPQQLQRASITSVSVLKNFIVVNKLNNVISELHKFYIDENKWQSEKINAPQMGSISIRTTSDYTDEFFFQYSGFLSPSGLYYYANDGSIIKAKQLPDYFDSKDFVVNQYETASKDGTRIPYFIVHHKTMPLNGKNPTLLYGYGGFNISTRPRYSATIGTAWLEHGGVYVAANIRGGGEFGPQWHLSALKENRQRAFDDFIAVAEDLVRRKITSKEHLGIRGGSNGGLLVGAAFTQRPDLFNAVVCGVPLLDMKRYNKLLAGASWMGEYGDPDKPEEWAYISKYSPYHNIRSEQQYPRIFFHTSTRDDRVHPGHARKMVAKMLDRGHEVFYYENIEGGHAAAVTNRQRAFLWALIFSYLHMQLMG